VLCLSIALLWLAQAPAITQPELRIEAPIEMAAEKARLQALDHKGLESVVRLVGLNDPGPPIHVELATVSSAPAQAVAPWVAGFAIRDSVVIFPSRSPIFPDHTLEDVLRHEIAHALIFRASAGRPVPRWFNEGLATAAERRLGFRDQTQLFLQLATGKKLGFRDIDRLFEGGQADQTRAYLLSGAVVRDLLSEHGDTVGGRILEQMHRGASFEVAFGDITGQSLSTAEAVFWERQRVWSTWLPIFFSQETLWMAITALAILAILRRRKRNAEMRKRWDEEEQESEGNSGFE